MSYAYHFNTPGWATFGLALPEADDAVVVQLGTLATQVDVKNLWAGSDAIRFAIVTAQVPAAGDYPLTVSSDPLSATRRPDHPVPQEFPAVSVTYTIAGQPWTSTLPSSASDHWLSGPLVTEGRAVVVPVNGSTPHALLQTVFDVRVYHDGTYRLDVCGMNCKDISAADQITYDLTITINGQTVYSKAACLHMYLKRWRKVFWRGGTPEAQITPDLDSFFLAGRFERYLSQVVNPTYVYSGPTWDILQNGTYYGDMLAAMPCVGGRPEVGPYPAWATQYLVHKTQNLRAALLARGDLGGSWSGHLTEPDGVSIVRLDKGDPSKRPGYWFDSRWHDSGTDGPKNNGTGTGERTQAPHLYSIYQIPYALTGDRYYLDGLKGFANQQILQTYTGACMSPVPGFDVDFSRQGAKGLFAPYANEPRGFAWGFREVVDAAEACPDGDPDQAYFRTIVQHNLDWADWYARTVPGGFFPSTFDEDSPQSTFPGHGVLNTWQLDYLVWSMDNARRKGFGPTRAFRDRINTANIKCMLPPMNPVVGMALYYPWVGDVSGNTYHRYATIEEFISRLAPSSGYVIGYYGSDMRLSLMQGVRDGLPGAGEAMSYLLAYRDQQGTSIIDDICSQARSQYAITYAGTSAPPPEEITPPPSGGSITITAQIRTANELDPDHANNTATATITPSTTTPPADKHADQAITLVVDDPAAPIGHTVQLTGTWTNHGPALGTGCTASIGWPARLTYLSHTVSQGSYDPAAKVWTLGTVAVGASATLVVTARVEPA